MWESLKGAPQEHWLEGAEGGTKRYGYRGTRGVRRDLPAPGLQSDKSYKEQREKKKSGRKIEMGGRVG